MDGVGLHLRASATGSMSILYHHQIALDINEETATRLCPRPIHQHTHFDWNVTWIQKLSKAFLSRREPNPVKSTTLTVEI